ncbi:glycoside hydrolase [Crucibulum laeve]|uniref:chitinase n=1 Tax=Crucibulum laeve TaxID=68775 RepID=A0A5C3M505_9AGAR|nr:glycoside hydrolase [Crucibulum laeve]
MVFSWNKALLAAIVGLCSALNVLSAPLEFGSQNLTIAARSSLARSTNAVPVAPHFVIYSDEFVSGQTGPPPVSQVKGYNVFALSFLLTEGAFDKAAEWTQLSDAQRASVKSQYATAGIKLIVSLFGSTDAPTSSGADPVSTANTMAAWVKKFNLDGVDVDYEDFNAINAGDGKAEAWLATFTKQLRVQLPQGTFILTHAPVAPWFSPNKFGGGAYLKVHSTVGNLIDWYNVQFYNQGTSEYTTCSGLLTTSSNTWPQSALFQIANNGVPLSKLVIGKPATAGDASNGFMTTSTLASCVQQAKNQGWNAGVMVWEFPDAAASWIQSVRALAFPE